MLHYIKFKNFYSFKEEVFIDFRVGAKDLKNESVIKSPSGENLSKLMVVIGANASGKTNAIKPLAFLKYFICSAYYRSKPEAKIPIEQHLLARNKLTEFEIQFELDKKIYRYELALNQEQVFKENLYIKATSQFSYIFRRAWDKKSDHYEWSVKSFFDFSKNQTRKLRKNASLITIAYQAQSTLAEKLIGLFSNIETNVNKEGRFYSKPDDVHASAAYFYNEVDLLKDANLILKGFDFGINRIEIYKTSRKNDDNSEKDIYIPSVIHGDGKHSFTLPLISESSGTKGAFVLLSTILPVLNTGGTAVIDELESDLHPHLIGKIINLFSSNTTNPLGAQLIFTCHAMEVLNHLMKYQITLVEKDDQLCSDLWRLDDIEGVRPDENFLAKYMAGVYGAIPRI